VIYKKQSREILILGKSRVYLTIIVLAGLILRIYNLGKYGFWFDEAGSLFIADRLRDHFFFIRLEEGLGRPFILLVKIWMNLGSGEFFLRLFSVVFGILAVILIYRLGKFIFSEKAGILASLFLSLSPLHIYYSQEITGYSFSIFLALVSSYYFLKIFKDHDRLSAFLFVIASVAFIYSHPVNIMLILAQNIFFFLFYSKDKRLRGEWVYLQLSIFLLSLPWLIIMMSKFLKFSQWNIFYWISKPDLTTFIQTFMVFALGYNASWQLQVASLIIFFLYRISSRAIRGRRSIW